MRETQVVIKLANQPRPHYSFVKNTNKPNLFLICSFYSWNYIICTLILFIYFMISFKSFLFPFSQASHQWFLQWLISCLLAGGGAGHWLQLLELLLGIKIYTFHCDWKMNYWNNLSKWNWEQWKIILIK